MERRPLRDGDRDQRRRVVQESPDATDAPGIMDMSPTVLKLLGVALPAGLDGKPIAVYSKTS